MFRKLYLLFAIRSLSKSLKTYSNTQNGKETLSIYYEALQDREFRDNQDEGGE